MCTRPSSIPLPTGFAATIYIQHIFYPDLTIVYSRHNIAPCTIDEARAPAAPYISKLRLHAYRYKYDTKLCTLTGAAGCDTEISLVKLSGGVACDTECLFATLFLGAKAGSAVVANDRQKTFPRLCSFLRGNRDGPSGRNNGGTSWVKSSLTHTCVLSTSHSQAKPSWLKDRTCVRRERRYAPRLHAAGVGGLQIRDPILGCLLCCFVEAGEQVRRARVASIRPRLLRRF
jgi:hypothetical protein